jgi:glycosidase
MRTTFEFHISRRARDRYHFDESLLGTNGRLIISGRGKAAAHGFEAAQRIVSSVYDTSGRLIAASDIFAAALIEEILHLLVRHYESLHPGSMAAALGSLASDLGPRLEPTLLRFTEEFPPTSVYRGDETATQYLSGVAENLSHRQVTLEEMMLLKVANSNPALQAYKEFFDDRVLDGTAYNEALALLERFWANRPLLQSAQGGSPESLSEILSAPSKAAPYSLEGQLQYLLDRWGAILGTELRQLILRGMDFVREEIMRRTGHGEFRAQAPVPTYRGEPEYERYSTDLEWMPKVVLIAKNSYVWLEQLSRKYGRWIRTLDQIPDEELDLLSARGFTGLWLIGLWERSRASQRIKQRMGQADAVASAYAVNAYDIAEELGGWDALSNLRARAGRRGIRLSADMVPNHMGIDSKWLIEHPEWFLSLGQSPFPSYSYQSENAADDERVAVILEDHYYDRSDAAVVFERRDLLTGDRRYVYHGNDGTAFPWNDTAQLDYTRADVREAVIQTILQVARNFPIIRFDSAMTLAKKHYQRLWFPEPGTGGAIPSRAAHGMTWEQFGQVMPNEFWREVVDRVAAEVPDTLLLAEAFWLLEGYFVRTLGMHRVYNSAFMHMLRDEDNAKYRQLIKNTLEFDPQILKRYVNFMSNPDEKTAVDQFGTSDKYFGVCMLLATLPGLPMFGHGQIEGLREKYGMDFRIPKWDEAPDEALIRGHEWKIFPLLRRRDLFADVDQFSLFDFYSSSGRVNEDVLAYSNRRGDERGLVIFNNRFASAAGWLRTSAACRDKATGQLVQRSLAEALDFPRSGYAIFRDYATHLEYIRPCEELWEKGMFAMLSAYQHQAFLDWRFVEGSGWEAVSGALNGSGAESVQQVWNDLHGVAGRPTATQAAPSTRKRAVRRAGSSKPRPQKAAAKKVSPKKQAAKKRAVRSAAKKPKPRAAAKKSSPRKKGAGSKPTKQPSTRRASKKTARR